MLEVKNLSKIYKSKVKNHGVISFSGYHAVVFDPFLAFSAKKSYLY